MYPEEMFLHVVATAGIAVALVLMWPVYFVLAIVWDSIQLDGKEVSNRRYRLAVKYANIGILIGLLSSMLFAFLDGLSGTNILGLVGFATSGVVSVYLYRENVRMGL